MNKILLTFAVVLAVTTTIMANGGPQGVDEYVPPSGGLDNNPSETPPVNEVTYETSPPEEYHSKGYRGSETLPEESRQEIDIKNEMKVLVIKQNVCNRVLNSRTSSAAARGRAKNDLQTIKSRLSNLEKNFEARTARAEERLDVHSDLVWGHEAQLNNPENGIVKRVSEIEINGATKKDIENLSNSDSAITGRVNRLEDSMILIGIVLGATIILCAFGFALRRRN